MADKFDRLVKMHRLTGDALTHPGKCQLCGRAIYPAQSTIVRGQRVAQVYCSTKCSNAAAGLRRRKVSPDRVRARYAMERNAKERGARARTARAFGISWQRTSQICMAEQWRTL
jgi:ribosomal protein L24E